MDHAAIPEMHEAIGANNPQDSYSTLEVAVSTPDYDKEVVYPPQYPYSQDQEYHQQEQVQGSEDGPSIWGATRPNTAGGERRICGVKRRTFLIIAWVATLVIAVAIGVGAGLGATMRSRTGDGSPQSQGGAAATATATTSTSKTDLAAVTGTPTTSHSRTSVMSDMDIPTSSPAPKTDNKNNALTVLSTLKTQITTTATQTTTVDPPPLPTTSNPPPLPTISTKTPQIGGSGGRCQNQWGSDCICLDQGICVNKWKGTPYSGYEGNWPCPDDPDNIMACVVKPCLGQDKTGQTQCLWREGCSQLLETGGGGGGGGTGAPICPGDGDFVCCAHPW